MKKYLIFCVIVLLVISMAACGNAENAVNAPQGEDTTSNAAVSATPQLTPLAEFMWLEYYSEDEFKRAIKEGDDNAEYTTKGIEYYFKPAELPEGAFLSEIHVKDFYIALFYRFDKEPDPGWARTIIFEWDRTIPAENLDNEMQRIFGNSKTLTSKGGYYCNKAAKLNEKGEYDENLAVCMDVFWGQDGYSFHAVVPVSFTETDIAKYCKAVKVNVE